MSRNRILSILCCLPIAINTILITPQTLNQTITNDLKTPFIAETIIQQDSYQFKSLRTMINEQFQAHEEYLLEMERQRLVELERQRIEREQEEARLAAIEEQKRKEEQERIERNRIYCTFEVSFYTTAADEGGSIGASGERVQPWVSIALPKNIPFYSTATIEGLGTFINHDTGSYIKWTDDGVCRVDICVNSKEEAYRLGRFKAQGYIDLNRD